MREITVKELASAASRLLDEVEAGERVIVTRGGRPTAVIVSMEDAEDFILAHADEFVRMRAQARHDYDAGKSLAIDNL